MVDEARVDTSMVGDGTVPVGSTRTDGGWVDVAVSEAGAAQPTVMITINKTKREIKGYDFMKSSFMKNRHKYNVIIEGFKEKSSVLVSVT
ncbi:MAG: hypothetical protein ABI904_05770 [Chloroflexota bacterium]